MRIEDTLTHLKVDGFHVAQGVIPADRADAIRESVEATTTVEGYEGGTAGVAATSGLISVDQSFAPYLADERVLGVTEALFGPHVRISFTTAIINNPGNVRGPWHADWPFNPTNAGHIPSPYPDAVMHLTAIFMLSPFSQETGGTLVVPGSHRANDNPSGANGVDPLSPYPTETQATGNPGDVLVFDSRLWHATATNLGDRPRVGVAVRYAPWWLNLDILMPGSDERARMVDETGIKQPFVSAVPRDVFERLPDDVKPLCRHWVR